MDFRKLLKNHTYRLNEINLKDIGKQKVDFAWKHEDVNLENEKEMTPEEKVIFETMMEINLHLM